MRIPKLIRSSFVLLAISIFTEAYGQTDYEKLYTQSKEFCKTGNYAEALNCCIKALKIIEQKNDCGLSVRAHNEIGAVYYYLNDRRLALNSFFSAKKYLEICSDETNAFRVYHNIGALFVDLNKIDSALFFLKKASVILAKEKKYKELSNINSVIAQLHLQTKNLKEAEKFIIEAEKYSELTPDLDAKAFAKVKRTLLHKARLDYPKAIATLKEAIILYNQIGLMEDKIFMHKLMGDLLALSGKPEATEVYGRLLILKDSVFKAETASKIADYRTLYESEKKELSIKVLEAEAKVRQQQIIVIIVVSVVIVLAVLYFYNRRTLKLKALLADEKERIQKERFRLVIDGEEKEKKRMARELHDGLGQMLSTVRLMVSDMDETNAEPKVVRTLNALDTTIAEVRNMSHNMMPIQLIKSGLSAALQEVTEAINTSGKMIITLALEKLPELSETIQFALFRSIQEVLNNSIRYSYATAFNLTLVQEKDTLIVTAADNGRGFDITTLSESKGIGWSNVYSRIELIGGKVKIYSGKAEGTTVVLKVPINFEQKLAHSA